MQTEQVNQTLLQDFEESFVREKIEAYPAEKVRGLFDEFDQFLRGIFFYTFKDIPNIITEEELEIREFWSHFQKKHKNQIADLRYYKRNYKEYKERSYFDDLICFMRSGIVVVFDHNCDKLRILFNNASENLASEIHESSLRHKILDGRKSELGLITRDQGLHLRFMDISNRSLDIDKNYNSDFPQVHNLIVDRLSKDNDKGLVLLHGLPGTGKTSYLRFLISKVKKRMIFMPPEVATKVSGPEMLHFLRRYSNSVLIIEDAENLIKDRGSEAESPVSALLNLSDGLLSDCLNVQVICSFNTDLKNVDSALLRKGRLIARYEFKKLSKDKATQLSLKLGHNIMYSEDVSLTEVYNPEEKDYSINNQNRKIGF